MPSFECNETQFIENISRILDSENKFVVNRRVQVYDDKRYGPAGMPDEVFNQFSSILSRKGQRTSVYAKTHFLDDYHHKIYFLQDMVHSSSKMKYPVLHIPYYKVEYSFRIFGSSYHHSFDVLFKPKISIEQKKIVKKMNPKIEEESVMLIYVLQFEPPSEKMLVINLPKKVLILDFKKSNNPLEN
ncbi:MAG: hypothetical protein ACT4N5_05560 [Nitrosopumilaceae archaeon]